MTCCTDILTDLDAHTGYGLSDIAIRSLDVIHSTTGLPWWATIIATTVAVRTVFFPITVVSVGDAITESDNHTCA